MNKTWLIALLVCIAILVWGNNLFRILHKKGADTTVETVAQTNNKLDTTALNEDEVLTFRYQNPFAIRLHRKKAKTGAKLTGRKKKTIAKPDMTFLGTSDNTAIIETADNVIRIIKIREKFETYTLTRLTDTYCVLKDANGHTFRYELHK